MDTKGAIYLFIRYLILIIFGAFNLWIIYTVFTPLTIYPVFGILKFIDSGTSLLISNVIVFRGVDAQIIPACVAGAAYYLLLILNLTTPLRITKRLGNLAFILITFLALNILRILIFIALAASGSPYFDSAHQLVWNFGSTLMVVALWFLGVYIFKIQSIPIYSDIRELFSR
jgi:exosortase/archaeosortase family protein